MDEDRRKRAENLNRIKQMNVAAPKDRTLFHRMEQDYAARSAAEEQAKRQAVMDERHRSYRQPAAEVRCCPYGASEHRVRFGAGTPRRGGDATAPRGETAVRQPRAAWAGGAGAPRLHLSTHTPLRPRLRRNKRRGARPFPGVP